MVIRVLTFSIIFAYHNLFFSTTIDMDESRKYYQYGLFTVFQKIELARSGTSGTDIDLDSWLFNKKKINS